MNKTMLKGVVAAGLLVAVGSVQAEDGMDVGVGARVSTLGLGVEIGTALNDKFGVRLGLNKYSMSDDQTIDDVKYDADLDLSSTALLLDWYPMGGSFHLTAGYLSNGSELTAKATPATSVQIGDNTYAPTDIGSINASVELGSGAYIGLGWGNLPASGFGFTIELGVVKQGTPSVKMVIDDPNGVIAAAGDIDKEIANAEADLDQFDTYPVIAVGLSYGF